VTSRIAQQKRLGQVAGSVIVALSLLYLALQLQHVWPQVRGVHLHIIPMMIAIFFGVVSLTMSAALWHATMQRMGAQMQLSTAMRVWFSSQIVRYVPGNVWHFAGRAYLARQHGVDIQMTSVSMLLELLQTITAALVVAAASLLLWRQQTLILWLLLLVPLLACYLQPHLLQRALSWGLRRIGRQVTSFTLTSRDLFALLPGYCGVWVLYGCGLYALALAIYPLPPADLPALSGSFAIAWVIGFLSIITPSGLGVREGVLGYLLGLFMPTHVALLLAVLARVWLTAAELGCVALIVLQGNVWRITR
jgi:hypothetical protein